MDRVSERISEISGVRIRPSLESINGALVDAGFLPQKFKKVIIAGTNGKGTVANALYRILRSAGLRVGLFTSPHICEVRERVVVDDRIFSDDEWMAAIEDMLPLIKKYNLTFYEVTLLIAYRFFTLEDVDWAIMEVGLGGRWDATNTGRNDYGIVTSVGLDHQEYLGNNLRSILMEKLQVVKDGTMLVTGVARRFHELVLKHVGDRSRVLFYGRDFEITRRKDWFVYRGPGEIVRFPPLNPQMVWAKNISLAISAALSIARREHLPLKMDIMEMALSNFTLPGRWDIREYRGKKVLMDVAHNPQAWKSLFHAIKNYWRFDDSQFVVGVLRDKNWKRLFERLPHDRSSYVEVGPEDRRLDYSTVRERFPYIGKGEDVMDEVTNSPHSHVVVTGSFYVVAEFLCRMK